MTATPPTSSTSNASGAAGPRMVKLRFRGPKAAGVVPLEFPEDITIAMMPMFLEEPMGIPADRMALATGFPPKSLDLSMEGDVAVGDKFRDGDMIVVREGEAASLKRGRTDGKYVAPCDERSVMKKVAVPADNSCLFHAVALVMEDSREKGPELRQRCAEVVLCHKDKFNATLLGQPPEMYARWISQPTSWGGALELVILSFLYQSEIVVVDKESNRTETFGDGEGYATRCFVYYTGKHYDALVMASSVSNKEQKLFSTRDDRPLQAAKQLAKASDRP